MPIYVNCVPGAAGSPSVAPCADINGTAHVPALVEHAAPGVVHFQNSNELFAYGFSIVLILFAVGACVGSILSLIRKGS